MRIAQVVPRGEQPWSGVLTVIVHLSAALAARGHDVEVWQLHAWADRYADQLAVLDAHGVPRLTVPEVPIWRLGRAVRTAAKERTIDIVHLHGGFNQYNTAISLALDRPYVFAPHAAYDPVSLRRRPLVKATYRLAFERKMLERAALVVALTDKEAEDIRRFAAHTSTTVIPNGVSTPSASVDALALRRDLGVPPAARLAVFVGRLDVHRKGLDLLVRGIAHAPGWHLALVGPPFRDVERLERMVSALGVRQRVHLTGERHGGALLEAFAGADVFALLSRWEGLPMALLEAMSYGVPAVVGPSVADLVDVEGASAGWVAREGLGRVLAQIPETSSPEFRERRRAARALARRYSWPSVAERYEVAYRRALGSPSP